MSRQHTITRTHNKMWLLIPLLAAAFLVLLLVPALAPVAASSVSQPGNSETVILNDAQGEYPLGLHLGILEDPTGRLTIEDVSSPAFDRKFVSSQVEIPNYGYTNSVYWLRVPLANRTSGVGQWFLESNFQNLNYLDLYMPARGGGFTKKESGALLPFSSRDIPYYHVVFKLPLAPQTEETIYIRVQSGSSMTLAFTLWSPEVFATSKLIDMLLVGLFYGSLLIILGYHIFLFISLRETAYLYFVLFLASAILFFASYEGVADQFLWPGLTGQKKYMLVITMSLFFIAALKFSDTFLEQKHQSPRLHLMNNFFIGYWVLMIGILPFSSYGFMGQITSLGVLVTPVFAAACGIDQWRKGNHPAGFYLVSWLGFIVGLILAELVRNGTLPSTAFTEKFYQVGLLWLVLLWSLALADRIHFLKAQTEAAYTHLRRSEHELTQILDGVPLGIIVYGKDEKPKYANKRATEIMSNPEQGIQLDPHAGRTLSQARDYFSLQIAGTNEKYPYDLLPIYRALQGQAASVDDVEANLVDRLVPLEMWASPITDEEGNVVSAVAAYQDITQRKHTEAELEEYRKLLEALVEKRTADLSAINDWLNTINDAHQTLSSSKDVPQTYQKLSAAIANSLEGRAVFIVYWDDNLEHGETHYDSGEDVPIPHVVIHRLQAAVVRDPAFYDESLPAKPIVLTADQSSNYSFVFEGYLPAQEVQKFVLVPIMNHQKVGGLLGIVFRDPKTQLSHQQMLLMEKMALDIASLTRNAFLLDHSIDLAMVEERQRIARDLHDSVNQLLFSASLFSSTLPKRIRRDPDAAIETANELHRLTRGALAEMRTLLLELRPAGITKMPLGELLVQLKEAISGRTDLICDLQADEIPVLPEDVQIGFYRVAQEALNNVVRHSGAKQIMVRLTASPAIGSQGIEDWQGVIQLVIQDDGRGFNPETLTYEHFGLGIMRERASAIQAQFQLESIPGDGTEVSLTWQQ